MLEALKIKPYDLEPVYSEWQNPPIFKGTSDDDPVEWLEAIKIGCKQRNIPKEHWHRVGRHFLGPVPRQRLEELGKVMQKMSGDKATWNWKKFKIAVQNLGWESCKTPTETPISRRPLPKKQGSWWVMGKSESPDTVPSTSELVVAKSNSVISSGPQSSPTSIPVDQAALTTVSRAPAWLVNACTALDYLTSEHPKVMSAMSAILLTIGAIPAIPAISAGAGGAVLASGAAQAVGAVALGVGQWIKAQQESQSKANQIAVASQ